MWCSGRLSEPGVRRTRQRGDGAGVICALGGNDTSYGRNGNDTIYGGPGNDTSYGEDGVGGDTANGGLGSDTCTVDGCDTTSSC